LREVLAHLLVVDVEGGDELHVGDVVVAEGHVHQTRDGAGGVGVLVVLDALHERARAVADADDRDADATHGFSLLPDWSGGLKAGWLGSVRVPGRADGPLRSAAISSSSHRTAAMVSSSPWAWRAAVQESMTPRPARSSRMTAIRSTRRARRPSRMRRRTSRSVRAKKATRTSKASSSQLPGSTRSTRSAKAARPSSVSR